MIGLDKILWWCFSVIIVGISINIISHYLRNFIDAQLSKISKWWRTRAKQKAEAKATFIEKLKSDKHEMIFASLQALRHFQYACLDGIQSAFGVFGSGFFCSRLCRTLLNATGTKSWFSLFFFFVFCIFSIVKSLEFRHHLKSHSSLSDAIKEAQGADNIDYP